MKNKLKILIYQKRWLKRNKEQYDFESYDFESYEEWDVALYDTDIVFKNDGPIFELMSNFDFLTDSFFTDPNNDGDDYSTFICNTDFLDYECRNLGINRSPVERLQWNSNYTKEQTIKLTIEILEKIDNAGVRC